MIRSTDNGTEMVTMRWGMAPPPRTGGPANHRHHAGALYSRETAPTLRNKRAKKYRIAG